MPLICDIFWNHKRRYGARRIAVELAARGQPCGVDRVAKLLKIQGLKAIQPQPFKPRTTDSRHSLGYSPNLLLKMVPPSDTLHHQFGIDANRATVHNRWSISFCRLPI